MDETIFTKPRAEPFALIAEWLEDARKAEPNDAEAMSLATYDSARALPDVRMVLLKGCDTRGLVFYTNANSKKGSDLADVPQAALCLHWKSLRRQIRARGAVERVDDKTADDYFATRGRASQIGAWASQQSQALSDYEALKKQVANFEAQFKDAQILRPPHWCGYRVVANEIEFWQDGAHRLHHRLLYRRASANDKWTTRLLQP